MKCVTCKEEIIGKPYNSEDLLGSWCSKECQDETDRIRELNATSYYKIKYGMQVIRGSKTWVDPNVNTSRWNYKPETIRILI